jgi:sugar phosphate isomerase/epimerase
MKVSDYCIFSKHLQALDIEEAAELAAEAGFTGIDLAVRPGGHVDTGVAGGPPSADGGTAAHGPGSGMPLNAARRIEADIRQAVEMIQGAGLSCPMMVTSITDAGDPQCEAVLSAAAECGIRHYRMGYLKYDHGQDLSACLDGFRTRMEALCRLNEKYGIRGSYQNHGGTFFGASVWDLWYIIKDVDPQWIGCQYDVKHAVMEGGWSWRNGMRILLPWIQDADIKDGFWRCDERGAYHPAVCPLGEGMVDWETWRSLLTESGFNGPLSLHFEFPPESDGPLEPGSREWKQSMLKLMRQELRKCREIVG